MNRADPYCRCPDRISVAGIVSYCPVCRERRSHRRISIAFWSIVALAVILTAVAALTR